MDVGFVSFQTGKREGGERGGNKPRRNKGFDQQQQQPPQYEDRAAKRRAMEKRTQGTSGLGGGDCSTDLSSAEFAPTASLPASVHMPIDEGNLGARMLSKMGWSRGEGLGREKAGIAEPVSSLLPITRLLSTVAESRSPHYTGVRLIWNPGVVRTWDVWCLPRGIVSPY